jgi:hypothetical protein
MIGLDHSKRERILENEAQTTETGRLCTATWRVGKLLFCKENWSIIRQEAFWEFQSNRKDPVSQSGSYENLMNGQSQSRQDIIFAFSTVRTRTIYGF